MTVRLPDVIPNLSRGVMYRHCVEVYLRHQPGPMGTCLCGQVGCRSRYNASVVIEAAGVNPASVTAADAAPQLWHERPVPSADPAGGAGSVQEPAYPTGIASGSDAARPALAGGWAAQPHPPATGHHGAER
ncbi:hypothetical protein GA0070610_1773 [Micromonospora echinofusca]|uniref:Uncharacterized protein n=1 Tax=Micromonospora echinofusca TaxID=47858 RepID=A0A1C5G6Q6_MICEH|nr:hypothetical protein GA0070610_1773 [Micromonospora echinofusca]